MPSVANGGPGQSLRRNTDWPLVVYHLPQPLLQLVINDPQVAIDENHLWNSLKRLKNANRFLRFIIHTHTQIVRPIYCLIVCICFSLVERLYITCKILARILQNIYVVQESFKTMHSLQDSCKAIQSVQYSCKNLASNAFRPVRFLQVLHFCLKIKKKTRSAEKHW